MKAWITCDKRGNVTAWKDNKVHKLTTQCIWYNPNMRKAMLAVCIDKSILPEGCNPQWSDNEPIEVELIIKMKGE